MPDVYPNISQAFQEACEFKELYSFLQISRRSGKASTDVNRFMACSVEIILEIQPDCISPLNQCQRNNKTAFVYPVISVDVTHLKKNLDEMKPESRMSSLCNTAVCDLRTMNICKQSQVETIFKFSAIDESKLTMFLRLGKSKILQSILIDINEKRPPGQRLTVLEFFQETWSQAEKVWSTLSKEMQDGSMTMMHIDSYFSYWKQNSSHLKREISFMFPDEQDGRIEERLRQIKCYWILLDHEPHIRLVCELKKILQLKGDFNLLDEIIFAVSNSTITFYVKEPC